jgi:hypothetical protein
MAVLKAITVKILVTTFLSLMHVLGHSQTNHFITKPTLTLHHQMLESQPISLPEMSKKSIGWMTVKYLGGTAQDAYFSQSKDGLIWSDWETLTVDPHSHENDEIGATLTTNMIPMRSLSRFVKIQTNISNAEIEVHFYIDDVDIENSESSVMSGCACEAILYKSRTQWACPDGTDAPLWPPVETAAKTFVIHHQAGTANPPYDATVRAIWNYHTYTNDWGDIGYNWLIAPDGTIYQGRAWVGDQLEEVRGGHMCECNSNKVGICILGDLTSKQPTEAAYASLIKLIGAKACQFNITPDSSDLTPVRVGTGCIDSLMPNIIGHKHGCPNGYTACPGDAFAPKINTVRSDVATYVNNCLSSVSDPKGINLNISVSPNPATDVLQIRTNLNDINPGLFLNIYDGRGQKIHSISIDEETEDIDVHQLAAGFYTIKAFDKRTNDYFYAKFIKI